MTLSRQQAFQQLRPVCVELSSVALRFKGKQATIKQVYNALRELQEILDRQDIQLALDEKLAEYTFFPLTHVFNQTQTLSPTCIESAIACVIVLISKGWRNNIAPEMAKQLLILMTLLAGGQANSATHTPSDEVKTFAFNCINVIVEQLLRKEGGSQFLNDIGSRSVVDQLAYLLLDAITDSPSDDVQLAASEALANVVMATSDRLVLASLLPRTVSSLTKALRVNTAARRTKKVLTADLNLLDSMLQFVLADEVVHPLVKPATPSEENGIDESWLRATSEQVKIALTQVVRLRSHQGSEVRSALASVCFTVIQSCSQSLAGCLSLSLDTLVFLAHFDDSTLVRSKLEFVLNNQPDVANELQEKLHVWCTAIPRTLQANEDRPKEQLFGQLSAAFFMAGQTSHVSSDILQTLTDGLVNGLANAQALDKAQPLLTEGTPSLSSAEPEVSLVVHDASFRPLLLEKSNESISAASLLQLLTRLGQLGYSSQLVRACLDRIPDAALQDQIASVWLALQSLRADSSHLSIESIFVTEEADTLELSRPRLIESLYAASLPWLTEDEYRDNLDTWLATALAIECTVLQAQLLDVSYRPELLDSLYPMLSLLGSRNGVLREHAISGLNLLASACKYTSTADMLIDNADYLINSIGMKLNAFDFTPQAPQVLLTMVRLCGARIVPQIDDLIGSMFSALDNFHGYPELVEALFRVLRVIVDESKKSPQLAISDGMKRPMHSKGAFRPSELGDIVDDLARRRAHREKFEAESAKWFRRAPQEPWKSETVLSPDENAPTKSKKKADEEAIENSSIVGPSDEKEVPLTKSYKLLLTIAQSTGPHLTSPSPQVRQTLLQLLDEVSPLLAQHENSFLPLINNIWPMIVPRLLGYSPSSEDTETAYNACSAADVVATLCKGAGSFMSSRIDDMFPQLFKLFGDVQGRSPSRSGTSPRFTSMGLSTEIRSSRSQVLAALVRLLSTILEYVRVTDDIGDQIISALMPLATPTGESGAFAALEQYNADVVWMHREAQRQAQLEEVSAH